MVAVTVSSFSVSDSAEHYVAGFSLDGMLGAYGAARRSDLVATSVTAGLDVDGSAAGNSAYDVALSTAPQFGNRRATRRLLVIRPSPHLRSKQLSTQVCWASNFGGVTTNDIYAPPDARAACQCGVTV